MDREIARLQWITLGSIVVLILLCAGLLSVVWLCLHLTEIGNLLLTRLGRFTTEAPENKEVRGLTPPGSLTSSIDALFRPLKAGDMVIAAEELNWIGGSGIVVPVGALLRLVACHDTQAGRRWSATWKKCHLSSIPEDMLAPLTRIMVKSDDAVDHAQCERDWLAQQHGLTAHQPTASG